MRLRSRRPSASVASGVVGPARLDRRVASLLPRLSAGDVAVIDHVDLDRASAQALLDTKVSAVVNASPFISGRYPNLGPELLAAAGVVLVDEVGSSVFAAVRDGALVRLDGGGLFVRGEEAARGRLLTAESIGEQMELARSGLAAQLQSLTHNTTEFLRREQDLLLHGEGAPATSTPVRGRPVVVVVREYDYLDDLRRLKRYIREQHPVLVGVNGGADVLLDAGHRPDIVVVGAEGLRSGGQQGGAGVSDKALRSAREVVLHTDRVGRAVGSERLERVGVSPRGFPASGTSEDVALLLADLGGASLIVTVGTHATLSEFLDQHRAGQASTFLTRLRVGPKLVEAKAVPQLYSGRVRLWHLLLVLVAAFAALLLALAATPIGQDWWVQLQAWASELLHSASGGSR